MKNVLKNKLNWIKIFKFSKNKKKLNFLVQLFFIQEKLEKKKFHLFPALRTERKKLEGPKDWKQLELQYENFFYLKSNPNLFISKFLKFTNKNLSFQKFYLTNREFKKETLTNNSRASLNPSWTKKTYFLENFQRSNQKTCMSQRPAVIEKEWVQKGDFVCESVNSFLGELALGKNILIAYMPWQGYNFEDAILVSENLVNNHAYTTLHIEKFNIKARNTHQGYEQIDIPWFFKTEQNYLQDAKDYSYLKFQHYGCSPRDQKKQTGNFNLNQNGIVKPGTWVEPEDILVGKNTPLPQTEMSGLEKLFYTVFEKSRPKFRDTSLRTPKGVEGRVLDIQIKKFCLDQHGNKEPLILIENVDVYIVDSRALKVGDKMAGRHGNKGIVSNILPRQDMPYLPDGTPIDIVLNPLGVPSRMNVGQVLECLLGLAGKYLHQQFKIRPFDEIYGTQASRSFVYSKLYLARLKTGQKWLFQPSQPGKTKLFDGQTGHCFDQGVTVGYAYMLKLIHLVDEKIHARSVGPYNSITQQPVKGRRRKGGQRLGEMEIWALEGFGVAYTLHEIITVKSDDITGREKIFGSIVEGKKLSIGTAEAFQVLIHELRGLALNLNRTLPLKKQ